MPPTTREIERALGAELLEQLRYFIQTQTEWTERLAGQLVNHTLEVWSGYIPENGDGYLTRSYGVAAGCVFVEIPEGGRLVVSSAAPGPDGSTPPTGVGTWRIGQPSGSGSQYACAVVPLASRQVTFYADEETFFQFQVFTRGITPVTHGLQLPLPLQVASS